MNTKHVRMHSGGKNINTNKFQCVGWTVLTTFFLTKVMTTSWFAWGCLQQRVLSRSWHPSHDLPPRSGVFPAKIEYKLGKFIWRYWSVSLAATFKGKFWRRLVVHRTVCFHCESALVSKLSCCVQKRFQMKMLIEQNSINGGEETH